ncbi:MAG: hypothetical protein QM831_27920 [Kofleriaceae bacterium]
MRIAGLLVLLVPAVAAAEPQVMPYLYTSGNLRVQMACAETDLSPDSGLAVDVDGIRQTALRVNGDVGVGVDENGVEYSTWTSTDTGFLVEPGHHRIAVSGPGCAPSVADVDVPSTHSEMMTGRLAISDSSLKGTLGAPNGFGFMLGFVSSPSPKGPGTNDIFQQSFQYDGGYRAYGGAFNFEHQRRNLYVSWDTAFTIGSISGVTTSGSSSNAFTGSAYRITQALRIGPRVALHDIAIAGGGGLGYEAWLADGQNSTTLDKPDGPDGSWFIPAWVSVMVKPSCNWGFEGIAEYDIHPTADDSNGMTFTAGVMFQPSDSCERGPSLRVVPNM